MDYGFGKLVDILRALRAENGCPWDREQTHTSLKRYLLEECCEAMDAIDNNDMANLKEELGDVLLQVVFHSVLGEENHTFTIQEVIEGICEKMIRRHPHVFGSVTADTPEEVEKTWEEIKKDEKKILSHAQALRSVPKSLPALMRSEKVQKKAAKANMDFPSLEEALKKLKEEIQELENAQTEAEKNSEIGDILFSAVNISRFLHINPEFALTKSTESFINRLEYVENMAFLQHKHLEEMTGDELDVLWQKAKCYLAKNDL